ncbi:MAG: hypothetical protein DRG30_08195 [Epsilonproteobacteria bacterium]|nr:MAG: hypothetical protein DRG30_08195 [Campylobacterota bacterium]
MYDVEKLEREWENYKSKQRRPWIIASALFLLILLLIIFREDFLKIVPKYSSDKNTSLSENNETNKSMSNKNELNLTVEKSLTSESNKEINGSTKSEKTPPLMAIEVSNQEPQQIEKKRKYLKIELTDRYPAKKKEELNKKSSERTLESVERSFIKSGEYADALYLARAYYKKEDYDKALKWALVTNDLNSKLEESWLIFTKSKAQNGQTEEAIQVLTAYIEKTNSAKAKVLLIKIKKGDF